MKLYYTPTSPFARKVRIAAALLKLSDDIQLEEVETNPAVPNHSYAAKNPLMRVPALETKNALLLPDSKLIIEYLDFLNPGVLMPSSFEQKLAIQAIHFLADGALDSAVSIRYETAVRPEQYQWQDWVKGQQTKISQALALLNTNEAFIKRQQLWIDQIALVCMVDYVEFRQILPGWQQKFPAIAGLRNRLIYTPEFAATKPN